MKKTFLILSLAFSFLFFSCASKAKGNEDLVQSPETEVLTDSENTADEANADSENLNSETDDSTTSEETDISKLPSEEYDIPEDIEEPVIRDLPVEIPEEVSVSNTEPEEITEETVTPVEVDKSDIEELEPVPVVIVPSEQTETNLNETINDESKTSDSENEELNESDDNSEDTQEENNTEEDSSDENIEEDESAEEIIIIPSRSVTMNVGESLEVVYPGSGWIYMGSLSEYNNLASKGRKLGATDTKYTLLAKEPGTQLHHFYKMDNLTDNYIDDYLEVIVNPRKGNSKTIVKAPEYSSIVPEKPVTPAKSSATIKKEQKKNEISKAEEPASENKQNNTLVSESVSSNNKEITNNTSKNTAISEPEIKKTEDNRSYYISSGDTIANKTAEPEDADDVMFIDQDDVSIEAEISEVDTTALLNQAKSLFEKKEFKQAELILMDFFEYAVDNRDEALYLQGQILESDGPSKNIKGAIAAYENLTKNFPASIYWDKANKRIIYLKRFYIDVH